MRLLPLLLLSTLLHAWVGWRIAPALAGLEPGAAALWALLGTSALVMPLAFVFRRRHGTDRAGDTADNAAGDRSSVTRKALVWTGLLAMGLFSTLFVFTLVRDALLVLVMLALLAVHLVSGNAAMPVDALVTWSAAAVPLLALLATAIGYWNARRTAPVTRVDVPIANLPEALHGFSVAQISDLHVGPTIRHEYVQRVVARVNGLRADMVAITGDLVDGHVAELRAHVAPLAGLQSTHGTFFVTGNHEYYSGAHDWIGELRRMGVHVLLNEHKVLHHESGAGIGPLPDGVALARDTEMVVVAGVADYHAHHFDASHRSDPAAALAGAPLGARLRLLLAHQPRSARAAAGVGFDLQLSGHTHGGQFWPWMYFVRFQQPFTAGLRRLENLWVYTNRGTGYWGPPKRFGVPSEITHLRLVPAGVVEGGMPAANSHAAVA